MDSIFSSVSELLTQVFFALKNIRIFDIIDIIVIAFVIYKCIEIFRRSRGGQLVKGLIVLIVVFILAQWMDLVTIKWLLRKFIDSLIIICVIIFQPELRRALERVGRRQLNSSRALSADETVMHGIDAVCKACASMQEQKIGALIVFERSTLLGEISDTGTEIDAEISSHLICNIFFPKSPLHDGAVIIRDGRILSAGCILPLSANDNLSSALGTRHRAALGVSETSDCAVVVVSEETGTISLTVNGEITRNYNPITLREKLNELMFVDVKTEKGLRASFGNFFRKFSNTQKRGGDR